MAFAGIPAYFFRMIGRVPYILSLQEGDSDAYYLRRTWWWLPLYRAIHARAHSVHAISAALAARARRFGYAGAVALIPNGVDPAFFFPAASLPAAPPYRIITISRLVPKNGVQDLIRALNIMRAVHRLPATLMIIGAGFEERKLRALARALGVAEYVSFAGAIPHEQIPSRLRGAHAFARLSHSEGLGNAFLEAMACGVPVAGTPVGGIPDFLRDGENGILCPVRNPAAAAARIARALTDSAYADRIRAGGLKTARAHAWGNIAPRMRLLFDSVHL
jgi:glycosyltransferase involved in cell wall biosynthesis